ncbi:moesin/ezrin/radixin homolog 1-like [Paramacrobiotus metropolitanus]|uniref:moesin/ezrin/radixin homolog 1-like n=1 Tax=Paramacrobiotus metropolitanus TaxID=2943436 RepID=UPI0024458FF3|nr:moesin/ezrin/radixin homolog 1-like [Paramacrobiotus metropolitanus]
MPKLFNARITTVDAEMEFDVKESVTGKELFDQVSKVIGLREIWYFGLQYTDTEGDVTWIKLNKRITDHKFTPSLPFMFRVKFFPENVNDIITDTTLKLFYLQVKHSIVNDQLYCPPETSILLASFACQAKYGNYNKETHPAGYLASDHLLPQNARNQVKTGQDNEHLIKKWWTELKDLSREEAMLEYLRIAQNLDMYGVSYFPVKNKHGAELWLGVHAQGVYVYEKQDTLHPKVKLGWDEIRNVSFNDKQLIIKNNDKSIADVVYITLRHQISKRILALIMGNHELYMRRRQPDTVEIQQMKMTVKEEKLAQKQERERLLREVQAREEAEREARNYQNQIRILQDELRSRNAQPPEGALPYPMPVPSHVPWSGATPP